MPFHYERHSNFTPIDVSPSLVKHLINTTLCIRIIILINHVINYMLNFTMGPTPIIGVYVWTSYTQSQHSCILSVLDFSMARPQYMFRIEKQIFNFIFFPTLEARTHASSHAHVPCQLSYSWRLKLDFYLPKIWILHFVLVLNKCFGRSIKGNDFKAFVQVVLGECVGPSILFE